MECTRIITMSTHSVLLLLLLLPQLLTAAPPSSSSSSLSTTTDTKSSQLASTTKDDFKQQEDEDEDKELLEFRKSISSPVKDVEAMFDKEGFMPDFDFSEFFTKLDEEEKEKGKEGEKDVGERRKKEGESGEAVTDPLLASRSSFAKSLFQDPPASKTPSNEDSSSSFEQFALEEPDDFFFSLGSSETDKKEREEEEEEAPQKKRQLPQPEGQPFQVPAAFQNLGPPEEEPPELQEQTKFQVPGGLNPLGPLGEVPADDDISQNDFSIPSNIRQQGVGALGGGQLEDNPKGFETPTAFNVPSQFASSPTHNPGSFGRELDSSLPEGRGNLLPVGPTPGDHLGIASKLNDGFSGFNAPFGSETDFVSFLGSAGIGAFGGAGFEKLGVEDRGAVDDGAPPQPPQHSFWQQQSPPVVAPEGLAYYQAPPPSFKPFGDDLEEDEKRLEQPSRVKKFTVFDEMSIDDEYRKEEKEGAKGPSVASQAFGPKPIAFSKKFGHNNKYNQKPEKKEIPSKDVFYSSAFPEKNNAYKVIPSTKKPIIKDSKKLAEFVPQEEDEEDNENLGEGFGPGFGEGFDEGDEGFGFGFPQLSPKSPSAQSTATSANIPAGKKDSERDFESEFKLAEFDASNFREDGEFGGFNFGGKPNYDVRTKFLQEEEEEEEETRATRPPPKVTNPITRPTSPRPFYTTLSTTQTTRRLTRTTTTTFQPSTTTTRATTSTTLSSTTRSPTTLLKSTRLITTTTATTRTTTTTTTSSSTPNTSLFVAPTLEVGFKPILTAEESRVSAFFDLHTKPATAQTTTEKYVVHLTDGGGQQEPREYTPSAVYYKPLSTSFTSPSHTATTAATTVADDDLQAPIGSEENDSGERLPIQQQQNLPPPRNAIPNWRQQQQQRPQFNTKAIRNRSRNGGGGFNGSGGGGGGGGATGAARNLMKHVSSLFQARRSRQLQ